ncbi:arf-GAP with dual PH domain-containing protein 2 isoform X3 [Phasianus colchicus]|uniref:arf-GAP with dual PH domain-containing protein 2 isoform X3 n=1 Tax=Phasianus colchicus TaxID=9054 RepID=UPI00129D8F4E|nr:arf-GAP with dual PH domain-containing protein 2 isoform X3 [Phasianus colchicus]
MIETSVSARCKQRGWKRCSRAARSSLRFPTGTRSPAGYRLPGRPLRVRRPPRSSSFRLPGPSLPPGSTRRAPRRAAVMDRDRNKTLLQELLKVAGNGRCADCGEPDPEWASYKLGIFICLMCSGIHRNLPQVSRVKSLWLDFWENDLIEFMKKHGNLCAKAKYEAKVPPYYYIPQSCDCLVLREQWIRAKYEREEFVATRVCQDPCSAGSREGFLWKRGRESKQFKQRRFLLSAREGVMKYYTKEPKGPKAVISIEKLNVMFQAEKIHHAHGLQITYKTDGQTRNLFVYHESGKDAFPQGQVFIGRRVEGYEVRAGLPQGISVKKRKSGITMVTPMREFLFLCENDREQREWIDALNGVIAQPLSG